MNPVSPEKSQSRRVLAAYLLMLISAVLFIYCVYALGAFFVEKAGSRFFGNNLPMYLIPLGSNLFGMLAGFLLLKNFTVGRIMSLVVALYSVNALSAFSVTFGLYLAWAVLTTWRGGSNHSLKADGPVGPPS